MRNLGILLIDMQEFFLDRKPNEDIKELIESQKKLFNFAYDNGIPIFALEYTDCGKTIEELISALSKNKTYFIPKYEINAFLVEHPPHSVQDSLEIKYQNKELKKRLAECRVKKLILTGISKGACVLETAKGAKKRGYNLLTSEELTNKPEMKINWFYENSAHYETLQELLDAIPIN